MDAELRKQQVFNRCPWKDGREAGTKDTKDAVDGAAPVTETYNRLSKNKTPEPNSSMNHSPASLLKKIKIAGSGGKILFSGFKWEAEATLLWPLLLSGGGGWRGRDMLGDWVSEAT